MAKMNGCNAGMAEKAGKNSTRMDPKSFARNNLAKGGVNAQMKGKGDHGSVKAGGAHQGKSTHMPKGY